MSIACLHLTLKLDSEPLTKLTGDLLLQKGSGAELDHWLQVIKYLLKQLFLRGYGKLVSDEFVKGLGIWANGFTTVVDGNDNKVPARLTHSTEARVYTRRWLSWG